MTFIAKLFGLKVKAVNPVVYYDSLSDPVDFWIKIQETGDIQHIVKKGNPTSSKEILEAWHKLNDLYLQRFGLDRKAKRMLSLRKRLALSLALYLKTLDKTHEMEADLILAEIDEIGKGGAPVTFAETTASLQRFQGHSINTRKTSIEMYYTYIEAMKKHHSKKPLKNG